MPCDVEIEDGLVTIVAAVDRVWLVRLHVVLVDTLNNVFRLDNVRFNYGLIDAGFGFGVIGSDTGLVNNGNV